MFSVIHGITSMRIQRTALVALAALAMFFQSVSGAADGQSRTLGAFTAIPPVADIMQRVGAGHWQVSSLVRDGKDPHTFSFTPRIAAELSAADVYISCGMGPDNVAVSRLSNGQILRELLDSENGGGSHDGHSNDEADNGHEHAEGHGEGMDPHLWLDAEGIMHIARVAREAFSEAAPEYSADYDAAFEKLEADIKIADVQVREILAPWKGRRFYVQHDAFTRFAEHYGLEQVSVEEHDKGVSAARIAELTRMAREDGVRVLYAQPGHNPAPLETIADAIGANVAYLEPLQDDAVQMMLVNARKLAEGFAMESAE